MPVDEFGREIKGLPQPSPSGNHSGHHYGPPSNQFGVPQHAAPPPVFHHHGPWRRDSLPLSSNTNSSVGGGGHNKPSRKAHPSERYVDQPLLCGYVWKDQQKEKQTDENTTEVDDSAYEEYKNKYCLNYVRSFFNKHLDDSWFRNRYSPLARKHWLEQEQARAAAEALVISESVQACLDQRKVKTDYPIAFVDKAFLGKGTKTGFRKRKHGESEDPNTSSIPESHLMSVPEGKKMLTISEVPPRVNEDQLLAAFTDRCQIKSLDPSTVSVYSSSPQIKSKNMPMERTVFMVADASVVDEITTQLAKQSSDLPVWQLDVECRDAYGRADYDHDGKGGAPPDGLAVPPRKEVVIVSTQGPRLDVKTLSASLSTKERIPRDREAATTIARALDTAWKIPEAHRLDKLLDRLDLTEPEVVLDVAIAYLRRVHIFSFYNGCARARCVGDVWMGRHPAATVHLRLENADELLAQDQPGAPEPETEPPAEGNVKQAEETGEKETNPSAEVGSADAVAAKDPVPDTKDMLVKRLDDSIDRALQECAVWLGEGLCDEKLLESAETIAEAEQEAERGWLKNHSVDDDGRARCSFHFCRKLFKDRSFLHKHLLKKHKEYLHAEQAKVHDSYMMQAWDEEESRIVPMILVDCGQKFGLRPGRVTGVEPTCEDPEPTLWKIEEERMAIEAANRQRKAELRAQRWEVRAEQGDTGPAPRPSSGFVDVDDMPEEKVEMSFENVAVPTVPKKKKKKRKLL